ncbi:unnamed protein product [Caenorhabditis nigoni]
MSSSDSFVGHWKFVKADNFDEFMKEIGVGLIIRKLAAHMQPTIEVYSDGETWHINQYSTFKNTKLAFKLGEEFVETSPDDRTFNSVVTLEDGKLVHRQNKINEDDKSSVFTTQVANGRMFQTLQCGDVICRREFVKV